MVDRVGVEALHETKLVGDRGGVWHEGADPGTRLTVLLERLDGLQHELAAGVARHRAEALSAEITIRHRLAVDLLKARFVVEKIDVSGAAVLEEVDDAFRLWRDIGRPGRQPILTIQQRCERGRAEPGRGAAEELPAVHRELVIAQRGR